MIRTFTSIQASYAIPAVAAGSFACQILPSQVLLTTQGANKRIGLTRLRFDLTTAVATQLALVAAATVGTATTPLTGLKRSSDAAGNNAASSWIVAGRLARAWSVNPTLAATPEYFSQSQCSAAVGSFIEWTWPEEDPFYIQNLLLSATFAGTGILIQNIGVGATGAMLMTASWKEF